MEAAERKEHYLSAFSRLQRNGAADAPAWLADLRQTAIDEFDRLGFPTTKNEDWKYTSVEPIVSVPFETANGRALPLPPAAEIFARGFAESSTNRLVFVNGAFSPELSSQNLPAGITAGSLARALERDDQGVVERHLGRIAPRLHGFAALNTAFARDGALVWVRRGEALEEPLYVIFVAGAPARPVVAYPRNLFVFEENSSARIVEVYVGASENKYFENAVTEIVGQDQAQIDHYRIQREGRGGAHVGVVAARVGRHSNFTAHGVSLSGSLVRNDVRAALVGEGGECTLNGLYLAQDEEHVDNQTAIDHIAPHASSFELYKGILSGKGRAVFNGRITVHKAAQKTDARQTNKNLLLSGEAIVHTKPQLEIHADDVKCSHGSTIGQADRDALFYLRSRGLDVESARSVLSYAFASEVVGRMKIAALRERLDDYLLTKFGGSR
ncbi:MAG TPA: Fe-S cluster assembly protein SufD [Candidatus Eisenbacteria bacterium]|nr:Fe-S cluster assembly protein SufD [Candidatus Eisenbacteria bacterium]